MTRFEHKNGDSQPRMEELLEFVHELADEARVIARKYFRRRVSVESKADSTPVTVADREIESTLRALLRARYPGHGVIGEEYGVEGAENDLVWVLDPIDGTQAFVTGVPLFGSLIALLAHQVPILGAIEMPALGERWVATPDNTRKNDVIVFTSGCMQLQAAALFATSPSMFDDRQFECFSKLCGKVQRVRYGTDCYAYGLLAEGFVDLVVEADMAAHDFMALVPVVQSAGGVISDWVGAPLTLQSAGDILAASTPQLHAQAMAVLNTHGSPGTP